jgi:hypothetical protein
MVFIAATFCRREVVARPDDDTLGSRRVGVRLTQSFCTNPMRRLLVGSGGAMS